MTFISSKRKLEIAMKNPQVTYRADILLNGNIITASNVRGLECYSGGYAHVFPFMLSTGIKVAVRCWTAEISNVKQRTLEIRTFLTSITIPHFINFEFVDDALFVDDAYYPVLVMDWVGGQNLKEYLRDNINNRNNILALAEKFLKMIKMFHSKRIAHGDLHHENIKVQGDGSLIVLDYDSMYVPGLDGMKDIIEGKVGYQHPLRPANEFIHSKLDYFSELIIYLSLLVYADYPELWPKYFETEDLLFSKVDYQDPKNSELINFLLASTNHQIIDLLVHLIASLKCNDIRDLRPLEELIWLGTQDRMVKNISNKF